jgi:transglutaminase-like putative cysteine protease
VSSELITPPSATATPVSLARSGALPGVDRSGPARAAAPLALRIGYDLTFDLPGAETTLLFMLYSHPEVADQLTAPEQMRAEPKLPVETFHDSFGNRVARIVAPKGTLRVHHAGVFRGTYDPEPQPPVDAEQVRTAELPPDVLPYLLGSRYCEVDRLSAVAWDLFGAAKHGGERALAVNRWVFEHVTFGYKLTRPNKTALDTYTERTGVCRDMMHLAITFCRALGIPARYATGYLGDIDADPDPTPMDFSAFYEVFLAGKWWPMDARHGKARVGRVLQARGRDAADVALVTTFGRHRLTKFVVITDEITSHVLHNAPSMPLAMSA